MASDPAGERPDADAEDSAPDMAEVLSEAVRRAALDLPQDTVLPVVYITEPFPDRADR